MSARRLPLLAFLLLVLACTAGRDRPTPGTPGGGGGGGSCLEGDLSCMGRQVMTCDADGNLQTVEVCPSDQVCADGACRSCSPGGTFCRDNAIHQCDATGDSSIALEPCGSQVCRSGVCVNACDAAAEDLSNVGCEYYAVDLDNEYASGSDAAAQQFAVVLANNSDAQVAVLVEQNDAPVGVPPSENLLGAYQIEPRSLLRIDLPQREVDGADAASPSGVGTFLSSNAYKITTNYPVVAYQFNPIIQSFSNDASLLIPVTGLDSRYRVLGWPTANPISVDFFPIEGIPDHSFVTVVGTQPNTEVRVTLGGDSVAGGGFPAARAGETITAVIGPYDVLNIESDGIPGDLSGTVVEASQPVAVFSGGERGIAPVDTSRIPHPPGGMPEDWCCTEHLEEQVFPTVSWGSDFVITRSPVRSDTSWREPDIYRIQADQDGTVVTTNLPAPDDTFTLNQNEWRELYAQASFVVQADKPIQVQQILVSQGYLPSWKSGHGGDPSMILYPPYQQYRDDYVFLVPDTFTANYVVISKPVGTVVELDGRDVDADEFMSLCEYEDAGQIEGVTYTAVTCPVDGGNHTLTSSSPVGIMVYGYHSVGSYGYAGGANLTRINFI